MVRGAGGTVALKVLNSGLMLLTTVVLARLLGVRGYGAYAYAISWTSLLMIPAIVGLDTLLTREAARYRATDNWPALRGILGWADRIVLAAALTLAAALAVVVWLRHDGLDPLVRDCLLASALLVPFMAVIQLYGGSLRGLGAVIEAQFPFLVLLPMVFLAMLLVLQPVAALTAPAAVALRAASAAVAAVASIWLLHRILPAAVRGATPRYHRQDWLKSAVPFLLLNAAVILNQQVGVLMLGSMVGPEAAGVFDVARRMALLVSFALTAVNMPLAPIVADLHIRRQTERLEAVLVKSARVAAGASCLIAVALIALAPWALRLMGDEFTAGLPVLAILCLGGILGAAAGSVGLALNMTGHERATVKGIGIAACSNLLFNFLLIPHWGILGAALAAAASTALWNVLLLVWVWQHLGLQTSVLGSLGRRRVR
jgi:O-antigen/teichoic acid export membrane protein